MTKASRSRTTHVLTLAILTILVLGQLTEAKKKRKQKSKLLAPVEENKTEQPDQVEDNKATLKEDENVDLKKEDKEDNQQVVVPEETEDEVMDHVVDEVHVEDKAPEAPFEENNDVQGGLGLFGLV